MTNMRAEDALIVAEAFLAAAMATAMSRRTSDVAERASIVETARRRRDNARWYAEHVRDGRIVRARV